MGGRRPGDLAGRRSRDGGGAGWAVRRGHHDQRPRAGAVARRAPSPTMSADDGSRRPDAASTAPGVVRMSRPDLVVTGADVWTGDPGRSWSDAVAVRGDRVVALGAAEVGDLVGPRTRVIHAPGSMVVPGFQDAHVHAPFAGRNRLHVWLNDLSGRQAYLDRVAEYARANPGRAVDRRRRLGDGALPRRDAAQGGPRRGRPRPAGVPDEPRRPRRLGELAGAGAGRHHRRHRRPGRRADRARPADRDPTGDAARGSGVQRPGPAPAAADPPGLGAVRSSRPRATCTRSASPAGRTRGSRPRRWRPTGPWPSAAS